MPCYLCSIWVTTVASNVVISSCRSCVVGSTCECGVGNKAVVREEHSQSAILVQKGQSLYRIGEEIIPCNYMIKLSKNTPFHVSSLTYSSSYSYTYNQVNMHFYVAHLRHLNLTFNRLAQSQCMCTLC